jgi:hypothetical protein
LTPVTLIGGMYDPNDKAMIKRGKYDNDTTGVNPGTCEITSDNDDDNEYDSGIGCDICLLRYERNDIVAWSKNEQCKHAYHLHCITDWLQKKVTCPNCRCIYIPTHHNKVRSPNNNNNNNAATDSSTNTTNNDLRRGNVNRSPTQRSQDHISIDTAAIVSSDANTTTSNIINNNNNGNNAPRRNRLSGGGSSSSSGNNRSNYNNNNRNHNAARTSALLAQQRSYNFDATLMSI